MARMSVEISDCELQSFHFINEKSEAQGHDLLQLSQGGGAWRGPRVSLAQQLSWLGCLPSQKNSQPNKKQPFPCPLDYTISNADIIYSGKPIRIKRKKLIILAMEND